MHITTCAALCTMFFHTTSFAFVFLPRVQVFFSIYFVSRNIKYFYNILLDANANMKNINIIQYDCVHESTNIRILFKPAQFAFITHKRTTLYNLFLMIDTLLQ